MATRKNGKGELRVRMYRVGFGDFFLLTIPSDKGPQHILIDCGVTPGKTKKGDIGTIKDAVADMAKETGGKLALIVVTHRHQDHIIGFSRCADVFKDFVHRVDAVWMSAWENEYDPDEKKGKKKSMAMDFQDELEAVALQMQQHLMSAPGDDATDEALAMLENATGWSREDLAAAGTAKKPGKGGGTNKASLFFLKEGLGVEPQYYACGDKPVLPKVLKDAGLTAEILGPPPVGEVDFMKLMDLKKGVGQYLGASNGNGGNGKTFEPFGETLKVGADAFPKEAFREFSKRKLGVAPNTALEKAIKACQPAALFTAAKTLDDFLNNQSLVVLFTFKGKKLLFAGDAQGGNWEYWMFGGTPDKAPSPDSIVEDSRSILKKLDFYKVGHHGSTNATPIAAVTAMGGDFVSLCSTQEDSFGSVKNESEVPRAPLLKALVGKSTVYRSDFLPVKVPGNSVPAIKGAPKSVPDAKHGKLESGPIYVDYFPARR